MVASFPTTQMPTAMMRTSSRLERFRDPRLLRSGIRNAGEQDLGAAPPTRERPLDPVGGDGRDPRYRVTASREYAVRAKGVAALRWRRSGVVPRARHRSSPAGAAVFCCPGRGVTFRLRAGGDHGPQHAALLDRVSQPNGNHVQALGAPACRRRRPSAALVVSMSSFGIAWIGFPR